MTPEEMKNSIRQMGAEILRLGEVRSGLLQQWADAVSPLKVGDVVPADGYTFRGKKARITKVRGELHYDGDEPVIRVAAVVLKGDGTDGKHFTGWRVKPSA